MTASSIVAFAAEVGWLCRCWRPTG